MDKFVHEQIVSVRPEILPLKRRCVDSFVYTMRSGNMYQVFEEFSFDEYDDDPDFNWHLYVDDYWDTVEKARAGVVYKSELSQAKEKSIVECDGFLRFMKMGRFDVACNEIYHGQKNPEVYQEELEKNRERWQSLGCQIDQS